MKYSNSNWFCHGKNIVSYSRPRFAMLNSLLNNYLALLYGGFMVEVSCTVLVMENRRHSQIARNIRIGLSQNRTATTRKTAEQLYVPFFFMHSLHAFARFLVGAYSSDCFQVHSVTIYIGHVFCFSCICYICMH